MCLTPYIYGLSNTRVKLSYLSIYSIELVGRGSETQRKVGQNYPYLFNLRTNICTLTFIPNNSDIHVHL